MVFLVALYFFVVSITSAYLSIQVKHGNLPFYVTFLSSFFIGAGWSLAVRYVSVPLLIISAVADVMACMGFYCGLYILGDPINLKQGLGLILILIGLLTVSLNSH